MSRRARALAAVLALLLAATALTSCTDDGPRITLRVLAAPELVDAEGLLDDLEEDTGVELDMVYEATAGLDGLDGLTGRRTGRDAYDLAWLTSDRSLRLRLQETGATPPESTAIMRSPVVVGLTPEVARTLRAASPGGRISWADIADAAADGTLRFGMADPRRSDTGRAALVGVATAAAGTGSALREEDVSCDRLRGFRSGQTLTAASSR
ncbi:von Willebrand factor A, partial [Streptomyces leeuwenhoekii]